MLARVVVSASLAVFVAYQAPAMLASDHEPRHVASQRVSQLPSSDDFEGATVAADRDGHFVGRFVVNDHAVDGVLDTGATFVALNAATASDIGIRPGDLSYEYTVTTAAGDIKAARITLATLSIGDVSLRNVDALVVADDTLPSTLIGMSFLGRLTSYTVTRGTMRLIQ